MPDIIAFHTIVTTAVQPVQCFMDASQPIAPFSSARELIARRNRYPQLDVLRGEARKIPLTFVLQQGPGISSLSAEAFVDTVQNACNPLTGPRTIRAINDATGGTCTIDVDVVNITRRQNFEWSVMDADVLAPDPLWYSTVTTTTSPSVEGGIIAAPNNGDADALPTIQLYGNPARGNVLRRRRITVTDNTGRGMGNYLVRATFDSTGVTAIGANNYQAFYKGRAVPFGIRNLDSGTTALDVRVDVPPSGQTYVDVYYGSGQSVSATPNGLDYGQSAGDVLVDNSGVIWSSFLISSAPAAAANTWVPAKTGQSISGFSYGIVSESVGGIVFAVRPDSTLMNDADSMVGVFPTAAAASNALSNLRRVLTTSAANNEVQIVTRPACIGGNSLTGIGYFTLSYQGVETPHLAIDETSANVKAALEALPGIGAGNVVVTDSGTSGSSGRWWQVGFLGMLAFTPVSLLTVNSTVEQVDATPTTTIIAMTVSRNITGGPASSRAFVRYRGANQATWTDAWTSSAAGTVDTALNVPGAVQIAVGLEPLANTANVGGTLTLSPVSGTTWSLSLLTPPTVSVAGSVQAFNVAGSLGNTVSGDVVSIDSTYLYLESLLTLDCNAQTITAAGSAPWYGSLQFSDPDRWVRVQPSGGSVYGPTWGSCVYSFREPYFM
jgi:hypothetical protein